jgi:ATP-dependent Lon protease
MNPIFAFDELDKISGSLHGKEVINTLIHLIDLTTNNKYNVDNYLGEIELDLSQSLFIFTYNDVNKIDKILLDRIHKINIPNYTMNEKKYIINKHIIPQSFNEFAFNSDELTFTDSAIEYLLNRSSNSLGLRAIKHNINIIISRINTLLLSGKNQNIIKLDYKCLYDKLQLNNKRIEINKNIVEIILNNINKEEEKDDISYKMMYI